MKDTATANDLLKHSSLYREFQAEREKSSGTSGLSRKRPGTTSALSGR